jgi:hypothetical protein
MSRVGAGARPAGGAGAAATHGEAEGGCLPWLRHDVPGTTKSPLVLKAGATAAFDACKDDPLHMVSVVGTAR